MKEEILIHTGKFLMACYARLLLNLDMVKLAKIPGGPKIFAANHPTTTDPFFLGLLTHEPMRILVTANAFEVPLFREYLQHAGHIPVHRRKGTGSQTIARAAAYLQQGKTIGIFPEGALSPEVSDGFEVLPARTGAARIALQTSTPVIPVGIAVEKNGIYSREHHFSDRDTTGRWMLRGTYVITVGVPMRFAGNPHERGLVQATSRQITEEIRRLANLSAGRMQPHDLSWRPGFSYRDLFRSWD